MSHLRSMAQPLTRSFVVTQNSAYLHTEEQLQTELDDAVVAVAGSSYSQVGRLWTTSSAALFAEFLSQLNDHSAGHIVANQRETLRDLGTEIIVGSAEVGNLIRFRKVQLTRGLIVANGFTSTEDVGYVVIENDVSKDSGDSVDYYVNVRVARV